MTDHIAQSELARKRKQPVKSQKASELAFIDQVPEQDHTSNSTSNIANGANSVMPDGGGAPSFDFESFRIDQSFTGLTGTEEILVEVSVRKPNKKEFFRTHETKYAQAFLIEGDDRDEVYYVLPEVARKLYPDEVEACLLQLAVNQFGVPFLFKLRLPGSDGKTDRWMVIPMEAAKRGQTNWICMRWDKDARQHRLVPGDPEILRNPKWPKESMNELMTIAFKGRIIDKLDHPQILKMRGLAV